MAGIWWVRPEAACLEAIGPSECGSDYIRLGISWVKWMY